MYLVEAGMRFSSVGKIIRVEHGGGKTGVAVKLIAPRLELINDGKKGTDGRG